MTDRSIDETVKAYEDACTGIGIAPNEYVYDMMRKQQRDALM
jgi:hypothetical protein